MVKDKEEVEAGDSPKPETKKEDLKWGLGKIPTQFEPVLVKGDEALDTLSALAVILNKIEEIQKVVGNA